MSGGNRSGGASGCLRCVTLIAKGHESCRPHHSTCGWFQSQCVQIKGHVLVIHSSQRHVYVREMRSVEVSTSQIHPSGLGRDARTIADRLQPGVLPTYVRMRTLTVYSRLTWFSGGDAKSSVRNCPNRLGGVPCASQHHRTPGQLQPYRYDRFWPLQIGLTLVINCLTVVTRHTQS